MRIGVFAVGQNPHTDKPTEYISKSHAKCQTRRNLAVWVGKGYIQLIAIRKAILSNTPAYSGVSQLKYIPTKLPPAELPGIRFQSPLINRPLYLGDLFQGAYETR